MRRGAMLALWMVLAGAAQARGAEPVARIPLGPMGYQTMVPEFLLAGSSMLRVDFVDAEHLLVTFGLRQLMERLPGDPVDDDDRTVGAAVVELPTGKALARTEWRLHDRGQYLWELGHGRFLLRVRDRLSVIAPMAAGGAKDAFRETPLLHIERHIVALMVSANEDLLTVETTKLTPGEAGEAGVEAGPSGDLVIHDPAQTDPAPVQLNFYRLMSTGAGAEGLVVTSAGAIRARTAIELPMTTGRRIVNHQVPRWPRFHAGLPRLARRELRRSTVNRSSFADTINATMCRSICSSGVSRNASFAPPAAIGAITDSRSRTRSRNLPCPSAHRYCPRSCSRHWVRASTLPVGSSTTAAPTVRSSSSTGSPGRRSINWRNPNVTSRCSASTKSTLSIELPASRNSGTIVWYPIGPSGMRATGSAPRACAAPASTIHNASIAPLRIVSLLFHTHANPANRQPHRSKPHRSWPNRKNPPPPSHGVIIETSSPLNL